MDKPDAWLLNLYDGQDAPPAAPDMADEAASLRDMKALLDARPRRKPEPETISSVLAAARGEAVPRATRRDRRPIRRDRPVRLRVGAASALAVVLIAIVGILQLNVLSPNDWSTSETGDVTPPAASAVPDIASAEAERAPKQAARTGRRDATGSSESLAAELRSTTAEGRAEASSDPVAGLAWDDRDDVVDLHQRIEMIGTGVARGWESPSVPLEMMPAGRGGANILPAGQRR